MYQPTAQWLTSTDSIGSLEPTHWQVWAAIYRADRWRNPRKQTSDWHRTKRVWTAKTRRDIFGKKHGQSLPLGLKVSQFSQLRSPPSRWHVSTDRATALFPAVCCFFGEARSWGLGCTLPEDWGKQSWPPGGNKKVRCTGPSLGPCGGWSGWVESTGGACFWVGWVSLEATLKETTPCSCLRYQGAGVLRYDRCNAWQTIHMLHCWACTNTRTYYIPTTCSANI